MSWLDWASVWVVSNGALTIIALAVLIGLAGLALALSMIDQIITDVQRLVRWLTGR